MGPKTKEGWKGQKSIRSKGAKTQEIQGPRSMKWDRYT